MLPATAKPFWERRARRCELDSVPCDSEEFKLHTHLMLVRQPILVGRTAQAVMSLSSVESESMWSYSATVFGALSVPRGSREPLLKGGGSWNRGLVAMQGTERIQDASRQRRSPMFLICEVYPRRDVHCSGPRPRILENVLMEVNIDDHGHEIDRWCGTGQGQQFCEAFYSLVGSISNGLILFGLHMISLLPECTWDNGRVDPYVTSRDAPFCSLWSCDAPGFECSFIH